MSVSKGLLVSPTKGDIAESHVTLMREKAICYVGYEWKIVALRFLNLNLPSQQCVRQEVLLIIQCNAMKQQSLLAIVHQTIPGTN